MCIGAEWEQRVKQLAARLFHHNTTAAIIFHAYYVEHGLAQLIVKNGKPFAESETRKDIKYKASIVQETVTLRMGDFCT